jgi:hypothetical protein
MHVAQATARKEAARTKTEAPKRFGEVAAEWLKLHSAPNLRSHQDNVERYQKHVAPALGEVLIDRIIMAALLEFRGTMQAKELAPRTVNLVLALVRVATGVGGSQFHRDHRYPGSRPVILGRFFALTAA